MFDSFFTDKADPCWSVTCMSCGELLGLMLVGRMCVFVSVRQQSFTPLLRPVQRNLSTHGWAGRKKRLGRGVSLFAYFSLLFLFPCPPCFIQEFLFGKDYSEGLLQYSNSPESLYKYRSRADLSFKQHTYALPLCATEEDLFTVEFLHLF